MRVLIVAALFACAAAAPSGAFAPLFYQSLAVPSVVSTVSSGDIQAAAIDAQVKINDLARAAADQAQLLADQKQNLEDQAMANAYEKSVQPVIVPNADLANEKNAEAFWFNEDKKWQALDALKTAEAQIDGAIASNAAVYAKSAVGGVVPYVAAAPVAPVIAPVPASISPLVYSPYLAALKSVSTQTVEVKAQEKKEEKQEAVVKTAEPEKEAVAETAEKSTVKPVVVASSVVTPYSSVYRYNVPFAPVSNFYSQPLFNYASIQPANTVLTPTYFKTVW